MLLSLLSFAAAALFTVVLGQLLLPLLRKAGLGQTIRPDGPKSHYIKAGTPTMGGLMFVAAMLPLAVLFTGGKRMVWLFLFLFLTMAAIGLMDDLFKVTRHRSLGLTAKQKLLWQFIAVVLFLLAVNFLFKRGTDVVFPLIGFSWQLGPFYYVIVPIFLVGLINGVNLTDGLDGLAAGVSLIVFAGFWFLCLAAVSTQPIVGVNYSRLATIAAAMCGCCLGFLFYNHYPAKVFMGDTGSLALGGAVAALAVLLKAEVVLIILGGVYLLEALSVMIQVTGFKLWGKRLFRMSPLHHHYEAIWGERLTVKRFWLLSILFTVVAVIF
ncbi:MAG: phospho-N-acetylmuramoyl-pentapeptide-transferase, partial [Firmicutes bacterium]|nr:phospho-N-acetylmuramoyl-pentapeptide-transferase [Bacillota bacterium]